MLCLAKSNNDRIKTAIRAGPVAVAKPPLLSCMICILPRPEQRTLPLVGDCKITRSYKLQTAAVTNCIIYLPAADFLIKSSPDEIKSTAAS